MFRSLAFVASTIPLFACASPVRGAERPNILWLVAEDFGPELGCYGTAQVWSPNLDRLAAQGVRYTHAYTTAPVCSASRSAFMTGMYQTTIGAHNHRSHRDDGYRLPAGVRVDHRPDARRGLLHGQYPRHSPRRSGSRGPARPTGISPTRASHSTTTAGTT